VFMCDVFDIHEIGSCDQKSNSFPY
jgi:hypothetical protein